MKMYVFLLVLFVYSCVEDEPKGSTLPISQTGNWLVDTMEMTGTSIMHTFPVTTDPKFTAIEAHHLLSPNDRVLAVKSKDTVFVYPYFYMGLEVVNHSHLGNHYAVSYCPITESGVVMNRIVNDELLSFAASGLLYRDNLVMYDLETESFWSQMLLKSIHGQYSSSFPEIFNYIETSWEVIETFFPEARVFTLDAFVKSNFIDYQNGDKVFGVLNSNPKTTQLMVRNHGDLNHALKATTLDHRIFLESNRHQWIGAYILPEDKTLYVIDSFPTILGDYLGNRWDVFGHSKTAENLKQPLSYSASWWAWQTFFENIEEAY